MNKESNIKEETRKLANKEIILKRLFIKTLEEKYGDDYIKTMYRINPSTIRGVYSAIDKTERAEIEDYIKKQIEAGEINLEEKAKIWHRESIKRVHIRELDNSSKEGETR